MDDPVRSFYDDFAESYHLIFEDWQRSIDWQADVLGLLLEAHMPPGPLRILDCTCGIGTQALGLAMRGHSLTGADLSPGAIRRAGREAQKRGLAIRFLQCDVRDLSPIEEGNFDVVLAADNSLPHLKTANEFATALLHIARKLRGGGLFVASIRDYDAILATRPAAHPPAFFSDDGRRRIYHQVWDWTGERDYVAHIYLTQELEGGWQCRHFATNYRAILRTEISELLHRAGFGNVRWLMPAASGFYQPLVLAQLGPPHATSP
jgi:glycine/sarcosine N-methyltransferase